MQFEEILERIYVGGIDPVTNNHMYIHLTHEQLLIIREVLEKSPIFEVTSPKKYISYFNKNEFDSMDNIYVDFEKITISDLFNYIFFVLGIDTKLDYNSYRDLLIFIEILKTNSRHINLHLFNTNVLPCQELSLLNNLMFMNLTGVGMQIYLEDDNSLTNSFDEHGNELEEGVHYRKVDVMPLRFQSKYRNDVLEHKAS